MPRKQNKVSGLVELVSELERWTRNLRCPEREFEMQIKIRKKIKKWLRPPDIQKIPYKADLASKSTAAEGTCKWLLEHGQYKRWRSSNESVIAWLHGIQGSGKSTLIAHVINHLQNEGVKMAYIFCRQDATISAAMRINCLSLQMVKSDPAVLQALKPRYEKTVGASLTVLSTATMIFLEALKAFGDSFVVIDALDECDPQDGQALVRALLDAVKEISSGLRILCSSRNEPEIEILFRDQPQVIDIEITKDNIKDDISTMLHTNINATVFLSRRLASAPPDFTNYVVDKLRDGAQGMFLLPKYMVEDLDSKGSIEEISAFLLDLPVGLHEYYMTIINRIDPRWRPTAKRVFTWIAWAKRPLLVPEVKEIFSIDGDEYPNLVLEIKGSCGCLITIENDEIALSHSSVKRFLLESQTFRESPLYTQLVTSDPDDYLAESCIRYLFNGEYARPKGSIKRFTRRDPDVFNKTCPFLRYAALHWLSHCRESKRPLRFVPRIKEFLSSNQLLHWCEAVNQFITLETESLKYLCALFQTVIIELKFRDDLNWQIRKDLEEISLKLSRLRSFLELWGDVLSGWPEEIHTFWPLIDSPNRLLGHGRQGCLLTGARLSQVPEHLHDMLEKRTVKFGFDRFILADLNIFLWQSLMPSTPWDCTFASSLDATKPSVIYLRTEGILTGQGSERYGIDPAEVGTMQAATVLRKDLRAVAITWARYSRDKSNPLAVKTYAWLLVEGLSDVTIQRIDWTDIPDPCRVDLTISDAFRKSKGASAFSLDGGGAYLWTAGGKYDLRTGKNKPPPALFHNREISALTFCSNASAIAGIRNGSKLELYEIPKFRLIAFAEGDCTILGLSPCGKFVLFLRRPQGKTYEVMDCSNVPEDTDTTAVTAQEICLLTREKCLKIWTYRPQTETAGTDDNVDLEYFYNNGGLHSFSENETILVICVPNQPEWSLLAFDLESDDVAGTSWEVEYSSLLLGANILSFAFCPIHERRLYLLDSYGIMRILGIARKATSTTTISTVRSDDTEPILSAMLDDSSSPQKLFTATISLSKL
jgi:nucleoside-triphosphatase THEP1